MLKDLINGHILKLGKNEGEDLIVKSNYKERLIKTGARTYINSQLLQGHQNDIICCINIGYI